jgi:hypothetical protein
VAIKVALYRMEEGVLSSGEKIEGEPEEVTLCNLHDEAF